MTNKYWKINALAKNEAEILLYEFIGEDSLGDGISSKRFADEVKALGDVRKIILRINSYGGDVFEGNTIYNILKSHKAQIEVHIDGLAASIASVVAMAGNKIIMPENAMMMIHNPWGFQIGNSADMRKMAESLDKIKTSLVVAYRNKSNMTETRINRLMDEETWFTAAEAIRHGLADEMAEPVKMAAKYDLRHYKNVPKELARLQLPGGDSHQQNLSRRAAHEARRKQLERIEQELSGTAGYDKIRADIRRRKLQMLQAEL